MKNKIILEIASYSDNPAVQHALEVLILTTRLAHGEHIAILEQDASFKPEGPMTYEISSGYNVFPNWKHKK